MTRGAARLIQGVGHSYTTLDNFCVLAARLAGLQAIPAVMYHRDDPYWPWQYLMNPYMPGRVPGFNKLYDLPVRRVDADLLRLCRPAKCEQGWPIEAPLCYKGGSVVEIQRLTAKYPTSIAEKAEFEALANPRGSIWKIPRVLKGRWNEDPHSVTSQHVAYLSAKYGRLGLTDWQQEPWLTNHDEDQNHQIKSSLDLVDGHTGKCRQNILLVCGAGCEYWKNTCNAWRTCKYVHIHAATNGLVVEHFRRLSDALACPFVPSAQFPWFALQPATCKPS